MQNNIHFPISDPRGKISRVSNFSFGLGGPCTSVPSFSFLSNLEVG